MGASTNASSASSKRKKGEKKKRNNQTCSIGKQCCIHFCQSFQFDPSDSNPSQTRIMNDYIGVLMAYAGLLARLCPPLVATGNWVLGELTSCLPESTLEKDGDRGFETWVAALGLVSTNSFKPAGLSRNLIAVALAKVVERLLILGKSGGLLRECFTSLMEASARFNEVEEDNVDDEDGDGEIEDDNEDSEDDEHEETEEEFLNRYAEAAFALENGSIIEEEDIEDEDQEMDFEMIKSQEVSINVSCSVTKKHGGTPECDCTVKLLQPDEVLLVQLVLDFFHSHTSHETSGSLIMKLSLNISVNTIGIPTRHYCAYAN